MDGFEYDGLDFDKVLIIKSEDYPISGDINIGKSCLSHRTASGNGLSGLRWKLFAAKKLRRFHDNNISANRQDVPSF